MKNSNFADIAEDYRDLDYFGIGLHYEGIVHFFASGVFPPEQQRLMCIDLMPKLKEDERFESVSLSLCSVEPSFFITAIIDGEADD